MSRHHPRHPTRDTRRSLPTRAVAGLVSTLLLAGCAGFDSVGSGPGSRYLAAYRPFSSCDDLTDWLRRTVGERVTPWGFGPGMVMPVGIAVGRAEADLAGPATASGESGASSSTNVQETGIDEGDIAENDGRYAYVAAGTRLRVVDTPNRRLVSDTPLPGDGHQLILVSEGEGTGTLVVASNIWDGAAPETVVHRFALANGEPTLLGTEHLEGALLQMRAIGPKVHVAVRHDLVGRLPFVTPSNGSPGNEDDALAENRRVAGQLQAEDVLPRVYEVGPDGTAGETSTAIPCERIGTPGEYSGLGMTWIASIDVNRGGGIQAGGGIVADAEHVYASADSLYVAAVRYADIAGSTVPVRPEPVRTSLHRFSLAEGGSYRASGSVAGRIVSAYSLSEHDGVLRVATTTEDTGFGERLESGVRTFETVGDELVQIGEVGGLGVGESIQGVRFSGDLAFVVTFRQVDPLYVIDLTDPRSPMRRGELKIPGFSTWLLPLGDGRLLAFGQSGTDEGALTGVQWSLFDVGDLDAPRLVETLGVGDHSEAVWDPKALTYEPSTGLLLVPAGSWGELPVVAVPVEPQPEQAAAADMAPEPSAPVVGRFAPMSEAYIAVGTLDGRDLTAVGRIQIPSGSRRAMLVAGRVVSANADGSVSIADPSTLEVLVTIP